MRHQVRGRVHLALRRPKLHLEGARCSLCSSAVPHRHCRLGKLGCHLIPGLASQKRLARRAPGPHGIGVAPVDPAPLSLGRTGVENGTRVVRQRWRRPATARWRRRRDRTVSLPCTLHHTLGRAFDFGAISALPRFALIWMWRAMPSIRAHLMAHHPPTTLPTGQQFSSSKHRSNRVDAARSRRRQMSKTSWCRQRPGCSSSGVPPSPHPAKNVSVTSNVSTRSCAGAGSPTVALRRQPPPGQACSALEGSYTAALRRQKTMGGGEAPGPGEKTRPSAPILYLSRARHFRPPRQKQPAPPPPPAPNSFTYRRRATERAFPRCSGRIPKVSPRKASAATTANHHPPLRFSRPTRPLPLAPRLHHGCPHLPASHMTGRRKL